MITGQSHGLWGATASLPPPTLRLADESVVDVAIVGAGYTGLSTALHLGQRGVSTVVVEANEIGSGAAGRASGMVNAGLWVMPAALREALGPVYGRRMLNLLRYSPRTVFDIIEKYDIQCEAKRVGTIHCAAGRKGVAEIEERARQWQALGAPIHILSRDETAAKTGTKAFALSLLDLRAGTIQPLSYVRGLANVAIACGAQVFTHSPVETIIRDRGNWRLKTQGGSILAKWVLLSTDVYTAGIAPELRAGQVVLPFFHVATAPLSPDLRHSILPEGHGAWDTRTPMTAFRKDDAGRLIIGSVGALRGTGTIIHRSWARRRIRALFPQLGKVELEHAWYGRIGTTSDHLPRLHALGDNMIALTGFNGRGIAPGTLFGRELAGYIVGDTAADELFLPFSPAEEAPLRALKEGYYELGAQVAHLPPLN
ncbi:FAD-binding oxidoreductase [Mesorhizobium sp. M0047]|uniref:NAD(P)/FAD-dependent oxidoreductase n=1 Tax=Mesorhizobium sp. M0047 TaxID=2956859 RepID=UPI00333B23BC